MEEAYFEDPYGSLPISQRLRKSFGASECIRCDRFYKSVFLVLSKVSRTTVEHPSTKRARVDEGVSVGHVWCHVPTLKDDMRGDLFRHYERMKKILRFYSFAQEQIEIVLESTFIADQRVCEVKNTAISLGIRMY